MPRARLSPARLTLLLSAVLTAAIYLPRLAAPLMWDDQPYLVLTSAYDRPIPARLYFSPAYFPLTGELTWRPLSTAAFAAAVAAVGKDPFALRLLVLTLHALVAVLLAALALSFGLGEEAALTAAALFVVHPVHLETLMTVTFAKELLAALGVLGLLVAHRARRPFLGAAVLLAAALAKESGAVGLPLALAHDFLVGGKKELKARARDHALYALALAAHLLPRFGPLKGPGGEANLSALLPASWRLGFAARGFATSLGLFVVPAGLRIEWFALPESAGRAALWILAALAALAAFAVGISRARRREPALAFFLLWPLPFQFLVSNFFPTGVLSTRLLAERWLYLPGLGLAAAAGLALKRRPNAARALIVFWAALGLWRAADWSSEVRLWRSLVAVYPWSAKAVEGLGEALYRAKDYAAAESAFVAGKNLRDSRSDLVLASYAAIAPPGTIGWDSAPLERWLGLCRLKRGDAARAREDFERALALRPGDGFTVRVLAYLAAERGDWTDAKRRVDEGLALSPDDAFLRRLAPCVAARKLSFRANFD